MCVSERGVVRTGVKLEWVIDVPSKYEGWSARQWKLFWSHESCRVFWLGYLSPWCTLHSSGPSTPRQSIPVMSACHYTFNDWIAVYNSHTLDTAIRLLFATTSSLYSINIIKVIDKVLKKELLVNNRYIYIPIIIIILIQIIISKWETPAWMQ